MKKIISYAVTVCTEVKELKTLLEKLTSGIDPEIAEIQVLVDTSKDEERKELAKERDEILSNFNVGVHKDWFAGHFGDWKNKLNFICTGEYIIQFDADEIPSDEFLKYIPNVLEANPDVDLYYVPRINTVEGITQEDIARWHWQVNEKGWINYPDYQGRIYKNKPTLGWLGKVHERIIGHDKYAYLPDALVMYHPKTIDRQRAQNAYYNTLS